MYESIIYPANLTVDFNHPTNTGGIHRIDFKDYYAVVQIQVLKILVCILKRIIFYILYLRVITTEDNVFTQTLFFVVSLPAASVLTRYNECINIFGRLRLFKEYVSPIHVIYV
jgi:hypothetical protein